MLSIKEPVRNILYLLMKIAFLRKSVRFLSHLNLVPSFVWKRLPIEVDFEVKLPKKKTLFYSSSRVDGIGRALFWKGIFEYEREVIAIFCKLIIDASVFVDVGANTGLYSLVACAINSECHVIAFEPVCRVFNILQKNIQLNGFSERCIAEKAAVSNFCGVCRIYVPIAELPVSATIREDGFKASEGEFCNTNVTTIDHVLSIHNIKKVDIVKIDAEGVEDKVLSGMANALEECRPIILMEAFYDGPYEQVNDLLKTHNYCFYWLCRKGPEYMNTLIPDISGKYINYLAVPRERRGYIEKKF